MKKLLPYFLYITYTVLPLFGFSQNTGNTAFTLTYNGYYAGAYHITLANKQSCVAKIAVNYNSKNADTTFTLAALATATYTLPGTYIVGTKIRAKASSTCITGGNSGYIDMVINSLTALPIHLYSFEAIRKSTGVYIAYFSRFDEESDEVWIERSNNGSAWHTLLMSSYPNESYTDKNYKTGLNFYRLVLNEAGRKTYSNILMVNIPKTGMDAKIFSFPTGLYLGEDLQSLPKGYYVKDKRIIAKM